MSFLKDLHKQPINLEKIGANEDTLLLLYEVSILGMLRSYFPHTQAILDGYLAVKPDSIRARIAMGLLGISQDNFTKAQAQFEEVLKLDARSDVSRAYLGLAYKCQNKFDKAKAAWQEVIDANREPSAVALAQACIDQLEPTAA